MHHSCICGYICKMEIVKITSKLDSIGMTASTLCAIHCALVPIFITALPLIGLGFLANPWFEWGMIILAFMIGVSSISSSYFRMHKRLLPLLLLSLGFTVITLGHVFFSGWVEGIVVPLGGFTIATAHFINYKYIGACKVCNHDLH